MRVTNTADLRDRLPASCDDITIRLLARRDIDIIRAWPQYPGTYAVFRLCFGGETAEANNEWYRTRACADTRLAMAVDADGVTCAGYLVLADIDWHTCVVGNMGVRVRADLCGKGVGPRMMRLVSDWVFGCGFDTLRFDVAASNARAIRCYEKSGFAITGEFWRDDPKLAEADLTQPEWAEVRPHIRLDGPVPQLRFCWMERRATH
ncbi:MAG: GNAT family N-acetyltransferase [Candidatus Hydrogenedentes bacterium]|nr:GNAT family N-acetyltransferase [Candidatus Hydrogenedentota bacterium]